MALNKPTRMFSPSERKEAADNLSNSKAYGSPRRVWVEDGHVFVESLDGEIISMMPDVAILMGRLLSEAGADATINRIMDSNGRA